TNHESRVTNYARSDIFYRSGAGDAPTGPSGPALDEIADLRIDRFAVIASAENPIVANTLGQQMLAFFRGDAAAERVCGFSLTVAGNVVEFALDGEQSGTPDGVG